MISELKEGSGEFPPKSVGKQLVVVRTKGAECSNFRSGFHILNSAVNYRKFCPPNTEQHLALELEGRCSWQGGVRNVALHLTKYRKEPTT